MNTVRAAVVALMLALGSIACLTAIPTVATAAPQPTPVTSPAYPVRGETFSVTGRLTTHVARPVQLEVLVGTVWAPVVTGRTSFSGRYSLRTSSVSPESALRVVAGEVRIGRKTYSRLVTRTRAVHTLSVTPSVPIVGEKFTISDRLATAQAVVRPVVAQRKVGRKWRTVVGGSTDAAGMFSLELPGASASMDLRVLAKKVRISGRTYSQVVTKVALIVAVPQSGAISVPGGGTANSPLTVTVSFAPARPGRTVTLECLISGQWRVMGTGVADADGRASIETVPAEAGPHTYRGVASAWRGAPSVATYLLGVDVQPGAVDPAMLTITTRAQVGVLEPGGPSVTVPFTATNLGGSPVALTAAVEVTFVDPQGVAWSPPAGCAPEAYHASGFLIDGAGTINPGSSVEGVVTLLLENLPTNQDACKGVAVPLHISIS